MIQRLLTVVLLAGLTACAGPLSQFSFKAGELMRAPDFTQQNLETGKIAILIGTGGGTFRPVLGDSFYKALRQIQGYIPTLPPQEVLSLINRAGLTEEYTSMLRDYETSGILRKSTLDRMRKVLGVRYVIQLTLVQYTQDTSNRVSVLGVRFVQTRSSTLRVFAQIWDTAGGTIAWEGSATVTLAGEDVREKPIPFEEVAMRVWRELIVHMVRPDQAPAVSRP